VLGVVAVVGSLFAYFFSVIAALTVERTVPPTNPDTPANPEPHRVLVALGTNEATAAKDFSAKGKNTKDSHAVAIAKTDAENRKPERKIKPERLAHLHQPKTAARQRQNYEGYGHAMALAGLDSQR
jgi:hypothetical protein